MCIAVFMWRAHPLHPLLLLHNRDEYHTRPTKAVGWWECGEILAGKDEVAGGTWLACSKMGRVAFLTNVLELHVQPDAKSRGDLPIRFLQSCKDPRAFAEELAKDAHQYNGFNLIVADLISRSMVYISNRPKGQPALIQEVLPGIHVLTNAKLNSPWPKAERLELGFKNKVHEYGEGEIPAEEMVENLMRDTVKADVNKLPNICSIDFELNLSSIFVELDTPLGKYGTRSTSVINVKSNGEVSFYEAYLEGEKWEQHAVAYLIQKLGFQKQTETLC